MKMTPLDIRQRRFQLGLRGYARKEVEGFLELAATEFEDVVRENIALKEEIHRLQTRLEHHEGRERALQETMIAAQRISEDVKAQARKEADIIVAEAELKAEKIVAGANARLVTLMQDLAELKRQKLQFEAQLDSLVDGHRKLLDVFRTRPSAPDAGFRTGAPRDSV